MSWSRLDLSPCHTPPHTPRRSGWGLLYVGRGVGGSYYLFLMFTILGSGCLENLLCLVQ